MLDVVVCAVDFTWGALDLDATLYCLGGRSDLWWLGLDHFLLLDLRGSS